MLFMLDTNICIYIIRKHPAEVVRKVKEFSPFDLVVSAITVCELEYGASKSSNPEKNRHTLIKFLAPFEICPFNQQAASTMATSERIARRAGTRSERWTCSLQLMHGVCP